jgi:hypothetical protein
MVKRFNRINYLLDVAGAEAKSLDLVKQYVAFRLGKRGSAVVGKEADYKYRVDGTARGSSFQATIQAFGFEKDQDRIQVRVSGRCSKSLGIQQSNAPTGAANISGVTTNLLNLVVGKNASGIRYPGFQPAKAIVFNQTGAPTKNKVSTITGLKYDKRNGGSYTFPFGANKADPKKSDEIRMRSIILSAVNTKDQTVSFKDEKI